MFIHLASKGEIKKQGQKEKEMETKRLVVYYYLSFPRPPVKVS